MLSQTTRYALHLLGVLVARRDDFIGGKELSQLTGVPANYLSKILNQLAKHGVVESKKGWGGGFKVRAGAIENPIKDVLQVFDGAASTDPKDCAFGLPTCDCNHPCPLHNDWESIRERYIHMIETTRIVDLIYPQVR